MVMDATPGTAPECAPKNAGEERCCRCRSFGAKVVCGDLRPCEDCYCLYGSCCMEFGADDLWSGHPWSFLPFFDARHGSSSSLIVR